MELYHGTDSRIIEMTKEERWQYLNDCRKVIDALYPLFKPLLTWEKVESKAPDGRKIYIYEYPLKFRYENLLNEKGGKHMYLNLYEKLAMVELWKNGAGLYQYKDFYVCTSKIDAMNYSRRSYAGGETGLIAYRMIKGAEIIGFENMYQNPEVKQIAERIKEFAKEGKECPAIVTIRDIDTLFLFLEDGRAIDKEDFEEWIRLRRKCRMKFRYTKPVDFSKCQIELLNEELYKQIYEEEKEGI